jgi:hypothetical protein
MILGDIAVVVNAESTADDSSTSPEAVPTNTNRGGKKK